MSEFNPLVQRVDALLKRHQQHDAPVPPNDPDTTLAMDRVPDVPRDTTPPAAVPTEAAPPVFQDAGIPPAAEDDFPVLTEIVEAPAVPDGDVRGPALAAQVEAAVLEKVLAGVDATLSDRLGRTVADLLQQSMDGLRADLAASARELVREAVVTAVREELASRSRRD